MGAGQRLDHPKPDVVPMTGVILAWIAKAGDQRSRCNGPV
jgi:hypothetical protein